MEEIKTHDNQPALEELSKRAASRQGVYNASRLALAARAREVLRRIELAISNLSRRIAGASRAPETLRKLEQAQGALQVRVSAISHSLSQGAHHIDFEGQENEDVVLDEHHHAGHHKALVHAEAVALDDASHQSHYLDLVAHHPNNRTHNLGFLNPVTELLAQVGKEHPHHSNLFRGLAGAVHG